MNTRFLTVSALVAVATSIGFAVEQTNPIKDAMDFAHKAPKGEKKLSDKILDGTAPEADVKKTLELYKAMLDTKPPKGEQAAYKEKVQKLIVATEEVVEKKPEATAHYKEAVNCKACHSEHKSAPPSK